MRLAITLMACLAALASDAVVTEVSGRLFGLGLRANPRVGNAALRSPLSPNANPCGSSQKSWKVVRKYCTAGGREPNGILPPAGGCSMSTCAPPTFLLPCPASQTPLNETTGGCLGKEPGALLSGWRCACAVRSAGAEGIRVNGGGGSRPVPLCLTRVEAHTLCRPVPALDDDGCPGPGRHPLAALLPRLVHRV